MTQDLNVNPYYDDYSADKKFYRILFVPGRAVQGRELTQLQTILQNQTKVLADHLFEDGSLVIPGQIGYDLDYSYVKIDDNYLTVAVNVDNFIGKTITGQTSGVKAVVINAVDVEGADPKTLYIKYIDSGTSNSSKTFTNGEVLQSDGSPVYYCTAKASAATGKGSAASIQEGYYYVGGILALVESQTVLLDKYTNTPSYKVGLEIQETIVDFGDDASLLDPAQGTPNYSASGADRLKIELILAKRTLTSIDDENFIELLRLSSGLLLMKVDSPDYAYLEDEMAKRTYEESGNYTVSVFGADVREHLDDGSNRGIYTAGNGGVETKIALGVEPGIAYVQGYRIQTIATTFLDVDKARETKQANNARTFANLGNYIIIGATTGSPYEGRAYTFPSMTNYPLVSLRTVAVATPGTAPGVEIGTARARAIELYSGTAGAGTEKYKLYLFDIRMNTNEVFTDVRSVYVAGSPAFTANLILDANSNAEILDASETVSVFPLQYPFVSTVRDSTNSVDTSYDVKREFSGTTNGSGVITFGPLGTNEIFTSFNNIDYVMTRLDTGAMIDLTGKVTLTGSPTGKSIQITSLPNTTAVRLHATVNKAVASEKTKTLQTGSVNFTTPTTTMSLGRADIFRITGIYDSENSGVNATNADLNITSRYSLDTGQRDSYYGLGSVTRKAGETAPTGRVLIEFEFFSHGSGDYFSVDSYTGQIDYDEIPSFTSSFGQKYELRDCIDFRPRINDAGTGFTGTGSSTIEIIKPDSYISSDFQYYLNRIDKVYIDSKGQFGIIRGTADLDPATPEDLSNAMTLYKLYVRAYTLTTKDVICELVDNKRYTMRDIGRLEKRISNLEYYTSLSLLEKETADIQVIDSFTGLDRFKNGFIVDGFTGHGVGDVLNPDYKCAIDKVNKLCRPGFKEDNVKLVYESATNATKTGDLITLPFTTTSFISQPFASRKENVNPYNIFTFRGSIELTPPNDDWKDTETQPDLNVDLPDNADLLVDLATRTGIVGTQWGSWQDSWTGATSTNVSVRQVTVAGTNVNGAGQSWPLRTDTITTTTTSVQVGQVRSGIKTTVVPQEITRSLGDRVVSVQIIPYMRSREITFNVKRMKPNTRIYQFFDGVNVSSYCKPSGGNYGDAIITDANGSVSNAVFNIPNTSTVRFRTGERVFKLTDSSTNLDDNTTEAEVTYQAQGLLETLQETILSTRVAQVDRTQVSENRVITRTSSSTTVDHGGWFDPLAQTFLIEQDGGCFITSIDLYFATKDANIPVTVQLRNVINGYPGQYIFPFGEVTLNPSSVNVSEDGTTATTFTFPSPVYVMNRTEYCFVVLSDCNNYELFVGRIGDVELGTQRLISQQPYAGVMFKSQNSSTWTADQTQDIKFVLKKAVFNTGVTGTVIFENDDVVPTTMQTNPFITTNGDSIVRVIHYNNGLCGGDRVTITGVPAGTYNGLDETDLNGTFVVDNVEYHTYTIDVTTNATDTGSVGGSSVKIQKNLRMDVFQPIIQQTILPRTLIDWDAKTCSGKHPNGTQTPYVMDSAYQIIQPNDNNYALEPKLIASAVNETNELSGDASFILRGTMSSSNANVSPVIDTQRMSVITIANICDTPNVSTTYNFVAETSPSGGSSQAQYITRIVTLADPAIALKILAGVSKPQAAGFDLYYRVKTSDETTVFTEKDWQLLTPENEAISVEVSNTFIEYSYLEDNLEPFIAFQIKIVMTTTDSTKVPQMTDFRVIALGT